MCAAHIEPLRLDLLPERRWAVIRDLSLPNDGKERELVLRLAELGFVPGALVRIVAEGPGGRDPLAVRVGHTTFALRRQEAAFILVEPRG